MLAALEEPDDRATVQIVRRGPRGDDVRRIARALFARHTTDTWGWCAACQLAVPATTRVDDGAVWLQRECPVHGRSDALQSRHPHLHRWMEVLLPPLREPRLDHDIGGGGGDGGDGGVGGGGEPGEVGEADDVRGVFIDLTERCNLQCPNCLTDANAPPSAEPPTLAATLDALRTLLPRRPVVYLGGGEPTLLPDLLEYVAGLARAGYQVKLLTNGLALRDPHLCEALRDAGVCWVLLQFDSQREEALVALRGRRGLAEVRRQVLDNLVAVGLGIDLACMIDRQHNLSDMGALLRLGFSTPGVRHVSFMPSRRIGRGLLTDDSNLLDEVDMMRAIEAQTDGAVRPKDWMTFFTLMSAMYRLTRSPDLAPRRCFLPLALVGDADRFGPVTRPGPLLRNPGNVRALLSALPRGGRVEAARGDERLLLTSIETFREPDTIDLGDAARCSRWYLVDGKLRQACIHNVTGRPVDRQRRHGQARPL